MPLPSVSLEQSVADRAVGDMSDDRGSLANAGNFFEHTDGTDKGLVACLIPRANVVERQEAGHAKRLMVIQPTDVVVHSPILRLPPHLGNRHAARDEPPLDFDKPATLHHDSATPPRTQLRLTIVNVGDETRSKHGPVLVCWSDAILGVANVSKTFAGEEADRNSLASFATLSILLLVTGWQPISRLGGGLLSVRDR